MDQHQTIQEVDLDTHQGMLRACVGFSTPNVGLSSCYGSTENWTEFFRRFKDSTIVHERSVGFNGIELAPDPTLVYEMRETVYRHAVTLYVTGVSSGTGEGKSAIGMMFDQFDWTKSKLSTVYMTNMDEEDVLSFVQSLNESCNLTRIVFHCNARVHVTEMFANACVRLPLLKNIDMRHNATSSSALATICNGHKGLDTFMVTNVNLSKKENYELIVQMIVNTPNLVFIGLDRTCISRLAMKHIGDAMAVAPRLCGLSVCDNPMVDSDCILHFFAAQPPQKKSVLCVTKSSVLAKIIPLITAHSPNFKCLSAF